MVEIKIFDESKKQLGLLKLNKIGNWLAFHQSLIKRPYNAKEKGKLFRLEVRDEYREGLLIRTKRYESIEKLTSELLKLEEK